MGQGKSREIRTKIKSVQNTEKITKAMKLVSAAKLRKAQMALDSFSPYFHGIEGLLERFTGSGHAHLLTVPNNSKTACIAVYAGERALCGAFNANSVKLGLQRKEALEAEGYTVKFVAIGKKAAEGLGLKNVDIHNKYLLEGTLPEREFSEKIAKNLMEDFLKGELGVVELVYTHFKSAGSKTNLAVQFLPFKPNESVSSQAVSEETGEPVGRAHYFFEPSRDEILEELFNLYMRGKVHSCYLNSLASEYGSRMVAMDNASRNAKEMISTLTLQLNRARQAAITQEIAEIVGGAASLE
tara:strand:+ start:840 stop:1733 length:894 start_codon:yes stop_codon:yes gene_type:complete